MSQKVDYPLHIGITEAGGVRAGTIKSSIGIGSLLLKGIGDTMRISLTGDPVEEVKVGKDILRSLNLLNDKIKIVSCPTCGRCNINLIEIANEVEEKIQDLNKIIDHILREDNLCDGLFSLIFVPFGFAVMGSVLWQFHSYRIS